MSIRATLFAAIVLTLLPTGCQRRRAMAVEPPGQETESPRTASPTKRAETAGSRESAPPLEGRYVSKYVQIDERSLRNLNGDKRAELFATVPEEAFVYVNVDLDEKSAIPMGGEHLADRFPRRDEPLLMLYPSTKGLASIQEKQRPVVTTADGAEVVVAWSMLVERPTAKPVVATAPRALRQYPQMEEMKESAIKHPNTDNQWVLRALGPLVRALGGEVGTEDYQVAYERTRQSLIATRGTWDKCRDRVSAPYDKQAEASSITIESRDGRSATIKPQAARRAEERGVEQADRACGNREALQKKYAGIFDQDAAKMREQITLAREKSFEKATARFRQAH